MISVLMKLSRTSGFKSFMMCMSSWYQLLLSSMAPRNAARWLANRSAGAALSSRSMIFTMWFSGSARR